MENLTEKLVNELERVIQCREVARCQWRAYPPKTEDKERRNMESLAQFNEVIQLLKDALINTGDYDIAMRALALAERTP